ncbi:WD40-repeat-containing domain protein [Lactarius vividus]|nr:WD40-repeat-containing domain protein [Lactarius vividus]
MSLKALLMTEYECICTGFKVILSVVVRRYSEDKTRSSPGGLLIPGEIVLSSSPIAQNSFKRALDALIELMKLISHDQILYKPAEETRDALQTACDLMPTDRVEDDIQDLGEQICEILSEIQCTSLLKLFENVAVFTADYSNRKEFSGPDSWRDILQDFNQQLMRSKRNLFAGKDIYEGAKPYTRKQDPLTHPLIEETRSEFITNVITCNRLAIPGSGPILTTLYLAPDEDTELAETLEPVIQTSQLNLRCLDSTRGKLRSKIISWFESDTDPNVLWLSGAPGTGKTAIAWSLVAELKNQQRSAGAFFFGQYDYRPYQLWTTLAYEMTRFHPALKNEIYKTAIRNDTTDLYDVQMTFEKLIAGPLKALDARLSRHGPILLIDGLERCAGYGGFKAFLDTLPQWLLLPHHCKLIVISRPQGDIAKLFEGKDITRFQLLTGDDVDSDTKNDVHTYLLHRFAEMRKQDKSISENWPDRLAVSRLTEHASGFFKWAAVAVDSIGDSADRKKQLTTILESGTTTTFNPLDQYFEEVLSVAFDDDSSEAFRTTIGAIALSKGPLTMADLEQLLQDRFLSNPNVSLEEICNSLLPIISIEDETRVVKLRHKAYMDYITDSKRCKDWFHIDRAKVHRNTTISCLKIMRQGLKFNICGLKSSYHRNHEIEERQSLIDRCIPSHLAYACQFWADHLRGVSSTEKRDTEIVNLLRNFLNFHLLYWLEVLSLLSKSNSIASKSLLTAAEWLEGADKDLSLFAADGSRFSLAFADVIAESVPHIYLSALPFSPPSSQVYKRYHDQFPQTINVIHEDGVKWSAMRFSIPTNTAVYSISIHPDGKKVAAGMSSSEAVVISVTTGRTLCQLGGHESNIRTVAYSPSGKRIASGDLEYSNPENGALLFGPFELHSDWIRSLAWSPDGQRIVTGSDDKKVKVVVAETGHVIYDTAFHDDWVRTVICTTDDRTVRIIDAATGATSGEAWTTGQTGYIMAIAMSPDNKVLAAGSNDSTIVLYDMDKRSTIGLPLTGHTSAIRSLTFSKDGRLLASGSEDLTVRLWNVQTGKKICDPLYGHTSYVSSVRFSPDMKQLLVGAEDCTIRFFDMDSLPIWDKSFGETGPILSAVSLLDGDSVLACDGFGIWRWNLDDGHVENVLFKGHSEHLSSIRSASISPHGTLVATAGRDHAVMIWEADSGKLVCGPLEGHSDRIFALSFSADGKMVASGSEDQKVWVWPTETGQKICGPMEGHTASVKSVCFSPDGKQVASGTVFPPPILNLLHSCFTGSNDNTAIIWSVESGEKVVGPLEYHQDWIYGLAYSPNGLYLATGSDDCSVAIWNAASGERMSHVLRGHEGYLRCVNWSPDSTKIVTAALDHRIRVFDAETGHLVCEPLSGHKSTLTSVAFRSSSKGDNPEVLSASLDGTIRIWGLRIKGFMKTQKFTNHHNDWIHSIAISPVNDRIASGGDDGQVVVMDVVTGDSKLSFQPHTDWIRCVTYSPDGSKIATCSDDCTIGIWNAEDGERFLGPFDGHTKAVLSIAFSPDGNFLISGSGDSTVRTWDLHTFFSKLNEPLSTYRGHKSAVNAVSYARGGSLIISGSADAEIAVWEGSVSGQRILQIGGHEGPILSIRSFDEKIFSSSEDRSIRVWDLSTGRALISILHAHTGPINAIALSPDGRRIVSASDDASIRIFDSNSGEQYTHPLHTSDKILSVAVSHDGTLIACSGADESVHVWRANMTHHTVWPDSFMRKTHGQEFCAVDEQGILENFNPPREDGWLRGSTNEAMCWIPPMYRTGLWTPRTLSILGAPGVMLDMRKYVHGTKWEQCRVEDFLGKP